MKGFKRYTKKNKYPFDFKSNYPSNIQIQDKTEIMFEFVFQKNLFFMDGSYPTEFEKFDYDLEHMQRFIWRYQKNRWYTSNISIKDLLNVYMIPVGWLRRLSCLNLECSLYSYEDCINCKNKTMQIFTLNDCCKGFLENENQFSAKINEIKTRISVDVLSESSEMKYLFCTLVQNKYKKYFVLDGNSRLLAYALYCIEKNKEYQTIKCYIGERS